MILNKLSKSFKRLGLLLMVVFTATAVVACAPKMAEELSLSETNIEIVLGETHTINAIIEPSDVRDQNIVWTTNDETIASVDNGVITAIGLGQTIITAKTSNDITATVSVTVIPDSLTIVFEVDGGTEISNQSVEYLGNVNEPTAPTKDGHTFAGWFADEDFTAVFDFTAEISVDTTIYAKWTINEFTVTFIGADIDYQTIAYNNTVTTPQIPTRDGYEFGGWYQDLGYTTEFDFTSGITENTNIFVQWILIEYTVTFDVDGDESEQTVGEGDKVTQPQTPTKEGYDFIGWYQDAELNTIFDFDTTITSDMTLYAKFEVQVLEITFIVNGGSEVEAQNIEYNQLVTQPDDPTRDDYIFGGWFADVDLTQEFDFDQNITSDLNVYAKWEYDTDVFKSVEYNLDGGSWSITSHDHFISQEPISSYQLDNYNANYLAQYTTSIFLYDANASLMGWATRVGVNVNEDGLYEVAAIHAAGQDMQFDLSVYDYLLVGHDQFPSGNAFIVSLQLGQIITVTGFDITTTTPGEVNGFVNVYPQNTQADLTQAMKTVDTVLPNPLKDDFAFVGWYDNAEFTGDRVLVVSEDVNLFAKWEASYIVSFEVNGGSEVESQTIAGTTATKPTNPTKLGFVFDGWFSDSDLEVEFDFTQNITENTTLYAKWVDGVIVEFEVDGGSSVSTQSILAGSMVTEPSDPTKDGFEFAGWYADIDLTIPFDFSIEINDDITVYANWLEIYEITYHLNDGELMYINKEAMLIDFLTDLYTYVSPEEDLETFMHGDDTEGFDGTWHSAHRTRIYDGTRPDAADDSKELFIYASDYYQKWLPFFDNVQDFVKAVNDTQSFYGGTWTGFIRLKEYVIDARPQAVMMPAEFLVETTYTINSDDIVLSTPLKTGYVFGGWYDNAEFDGEALSVIEASSQQNIDLFAQWIEE